MSRNPRPQNLSCVGRIGSGKDADSLPVDLYVARYVTDADWQDAALSCILLDLIRPGKPRLLICLNAADLPERR
jgi:hypothetical protein